MGGEKKKGRYRERRTDGRGEKKKNSGAGGGRVKYTVWVQRGRCGELTGLRIKGGERERREDRNTKKGQREKAATGEGGVGSGVWKAAKRECEA